MMLAMESCMIQVGEPMLPDAQAVKRQENLLYTIFKFNLAMIKEELTI